MHRSSFQHKHTQSRILNGQPTPFRRSESFAEAWTSVGFLALGFLAIGFMAVSSTRLRLVAIALWLLLLPASAVAQWIANPALGDQQLWDFGAWGAEAVGKTNGQAFGETQITMAGMHVGRVFHRASLESGHRRTWEYTMELTPLFLVTRVRSAYGGGFAPVGVRVNFAPRGRYRPYLEFNGGAIFTQKNVPPGRTESFNFTAALGPGVTMPVTSTSALSFAVRAWHLSNGGLGYYNPSFNTVQFAVGYHWLTRRHDVQHLSRSAQAGD